MSRGQHHGSEGSRERRRRTKLRLLLQANGLRPVDLERALRERMGYERAPDQRQISRWCGGDTEPRRKSLVRILWAVRELTRNPEISVEDIIDLDPENPENWSD
jgi:hypothetical protein